MLPFFPSPYPDELFYGICARYHQRSCHTSVGYTLLDLFGKRLATVTTDFPTNINLVSEQLSPASRNTLDCLMYAHTMLPLYLPFLPEGRIDKIIGLMAGRAAGGNIHMTIGSTASAIPSPAFLRYCPTCLSEDERNRGEPYWHRNHQVPGMGVCHMHQDRLLDSTVAAHGVGCKHDLTPLSGVVASYQAPSSELHSLSQHVWLARSAHWLLNVSTPLCPHGPEMIRNAYLAQFRRLDLASASGRLETRELLRRFLDFYAHEFLAEVYSPLTLDSADPWLLSMLRKPKKASHPLRHLLIIRFLGLEVEEVFNQVAELTQRPEKSQRTSHKRQCDALCSPGGVKPQPPGEKTLNARRESWLRVCAANPDVGVKKLRLMYGSDYFWLYRHDREWLFSHSPRKPHPSPMGRVDWNKRDASLAAQAIAAAAEIRNCPGRPIRVTVRAIGIRLGASAMFEKLMDHLPRTRAALGTVVESRDEFASRRLRLAAERLRRQGEPVSAWRLKRAAGLRPECANRLAEEIESLVA